MSSRGAITLNEPIFDLWKASLEDEGILVGYTNARPHTSNGKRVTLLFLKIGKSGDDRPEKQLKNIDKRVLY